MGSLARKLTLSKEYRRQNQLKTSKQFDEKLTQASIAEHEKKQRAKQNHLNRCRTIVDKYKDHPYHNPHDWPVLSKNYGLVATPETRDLKHKMSVKDRKSPKRTTKHKIVVSQVYTHQYTGRYLPHDRGANG